MIADSRGLIVKDCIVYETTGGWEFVSTGSTGTTWQDCMGYDIERT